MTPRGRNSPLFTKSKLKIYLFCIRGPACSLKRGWSWKSPASPLSCLPGASWGSLASPDSFPHNTVWSILAWWVVVLKFQGHPLYLCWPYHSSCLEFIFGDILNASFLPEWTPLRARTRPALFITIFPVTRTVLVTSEEHNTFFDD